MGGGAGAQLPSSGGRSVPSAALLRSHRVAECTCARVFQVVSLDPVIEDDAELQKYSKVC